jgi:hypothetical protein
MYVIASSIERSNHTHSAALIPSTSEVSTKMCQWFQESVAIFYLINTFTYKKVKEKLLAIIAKK